nr:hypothetical protein [Paenibacillus koleovorans]
MYRIKGSWRACTRRILQAGNPSADETIPPFAYRFGRHMDFPGNLAYGHSLDSQLPDEGGSLFQTKRYLLTQHHFSDPFPFFGR